jgi:hypothetical protein
MKVEIEMVSAALKKHDIEPPIVQEILNDLKADTEEAVEKAPPIKKQYVLIVSDPSGQTPQGLVGWAVQVEEGQPPSSAFTKLEDAADLFHTTPKGRKFPVNTIGLALEAIPSKITREAGLWIKTREPVNVLVSNNRLTVKETDSL